MKSRLSIVVCGLLAAVCSNGQPNPNPQQPPQWGNIVNPAAQRVDYARKAGFCSDPWLTIAIWFAHGSTRDPYGVGQFGECNPLLYKVARFTAAGQWGTFAELLQAYSDTDFALRSQGVATSLRDNGNNTLTVETRAGAAYARSVVAGRLTSANGASSVVHGGNSIGLNASGVATPGPGSLVSTEGSTLLSDLGSQYRVLSVGSVAIKLPGGRSLILGH